MDRTALKDYAPKARREFIQAVTDRAAFYGLTAKKIEPVTEKGDVAIIGGRAFPRSIVRQRRALEERITRLGFYQVMEAMAYTWFNRFVALRYMELHQYLEHGYRVLSHPEGKATPEIIEHAEHIHLPGVDNSKVIELKLDGNKEAELYRLLLVAQCHALHDAMPFLFERIDDETELLLPDNLLHSDSVIRKLVNEIDEEDWQEVEIIGWIYQFYISEKKDQVIGKVVKSEDIPAATQLFTPNWIVKYLVQNTLGRQWLATYPQSALRQQMEYYIEPAEQTEEVKAQLKAITPESLNPEELTLLDPACGSGHILVEAYDVFKAIYQERGYHSRDIPRIILQKNLYGLEIDDRAAQLSAFALLMKARADDRSIFADHIQPNVLAIQESKGLEKLLRPDPADSKATGEPLVADHDLFPGSKKQLLLKKQPQESPMAQLEPCLRELIKLFEHGKTFGSLIRVPPELVVQLAGAKRHIEGMIASKDLVKEVIAKPFLPLLKQGELLARSYDIVVANPPYLGAKGMNLALKEVGQLFPETKTDMFSMFIERCMSWASSASGFVTPYVWMFLATYERLRVRLTSRATITSLVQLEYNAFEPACVPVCTFTLVQKPMRAFDGTFIKLSDFKGFQNQAPKTLEAINNPNCEWKFYASSEDYQRVPGSPIAFWVSDSIRDIFSKNPKLGDYAVKVTKGIFTGNNDRFIRFWPEVSNASDAWRKHAKGGAYRKWFGNAEDVVFWEEGKGRLSRVANAGLGAAKYFNKPHFVWSKLTSADPSFRWDANEVFFDDCSPAIILEKPDLPLLSFLNSKICTILLKLINPTLNYQAGDIQKLPWPIMIDEMNVLADNARHAVGLAERDWNSYEGSWEFSASPLLEVDIKTATFEGSFQSWRHLNQVAVDQMRRLEAENNRIILQALGLQDEVSYEVAEEQITLTRVFPSDVVRHFISYAVGCMMGRYSLDKPGLIYSHSGNVGFDSKQYRTFPADADGIIPLTEVGWFPNDAAERVIEFVARAWPSEHLEENLKFIADSIGANKGEQPRETIRRYLATSFYKDHLQTYKKRPIYWLFSSGKQRAFQCLVYLHRYHEGTLARMRMEYVIPLQGKLASRIEQLTSDMPKATSASHRKKLEKEQDALKKQQIELQAFDEKLRHYADMRVSLDLDGGVKVNYGKFGDLLADVKTVTGGSGSEE